MPTPVGINVEIGLQGDRLGSSNLVKRYFHDELGSDKKFVPIFSSGDFETALTTIGGVSLSGLSWRTGRGYLMSLGVDYNPLSQDLCVVGYARGVGFSVHHPVHVTGLGDFLVKKLEILSDVCPVKRSVGMEADSTVEEMTDEIAKELSQEVDALSHPVKRLYDVEPDEDLLDDFEKCVRIGGEDEDMIMDQDLDEADDNLDDMNDYFASLEDVNPKGKRIEFEKRAQEDLSFPDEVDTPVDIPARERFHKYRALKCIKEGAWDPYESLPPEYLQICEFENFRVRFIDTLHLILTRQLCHNRVVL